MPARRRTKHERRGSDPDAVTSASRISVGSRDVLDDNLRRAPPQMVRPQARRRKACRGPEVTPRSSSSRSPSCHAGLFISVLRGIHVLVDTMLSPSRVPASLLPRTRKNAAAPGGLQPWQQPAAFSRTAGGYLPMVSDTSAHRGPTAFRRHAVLTCVHERSVGACDRDPFVRLTGLGGLWLWSLYLLPSLSPI